MSLRDILVLVDERKSSDARMRLAAQLAAKTKARLGGAFQRSQFFDCLLPGEYLTYMPPATLDSFVKDHEAEVTKAAEETRLKFEALCADDGLVSNWQELPNGSSDAVIDLARRTDLAVVGPSIRSAFGLNRISAGKLGLEMGGPILVIGDREPRLTVGERILIAWKDSRESARALHDAWPLICQAKAVSILMVRPLEHVGADSALQRHLECHGVRADIIIDDSGDEAAGGVLRRHVETMNADLLVMGLFGRSRFSEILFGGVTQEFLEDPPVPLLMSH